MPRNEYPIEKQVITLEQAGLLAGLMGDDAPESLWVWAKWSSNQTKNWNGVLLRTVAAMMIADENLELSSMIPAYTGDELGALLPVSVTYLGCEEEYIEEKFWDKESKKIEFECGYGFEECTKRDTVSAHAKAALAIKGLTDGWIKKEELYYEE